MTLWIQRTLLALLQPLPMGLASALVGLILARTRFRRSGKALALAGVGGLYLAASDPVPGVLIGIYEREHPPLAAVPEDVSLIVVLTAGARDLGRKGLPPAPEPQSLARLTHALGLARTRPGTRLVISGGRADPGRPQLSIGAAMRDVALGLGFPAGRLELDEESTSTAGSARVLGSRFPGRRLVLVTSAYHMGRSLFVFRKAGLDPVPAPTDFQIEDSGESPFEPYPSVERLRVTSVFVYELLARTWTWSRGG